MAVARVVMFEDVDAERMASAQRDLDAGERPEGLPATELIMLHDREGGKALAIIFFENEDDYAKGDQVLGAMPADETPGRRASVTKYDVVAHART
jgi:hypothetical protein